jgi:peroxiredoxin Q/BCP
MAPRKASDSAGTEPRRSGRLASNPAPPPAEVKPKPAKATKKRSAEAVDGNKEGESSAAKKVGISPFFSATCPWVVLKNL